MNSFTILIAVLITTTALSQVKTGIILSSTDKTPVAYANIYSKNTSSGTITNDEGRFKFIYTNPSDSIVISHLGYNRVIHHISDFFAEFRDTIYLEPSIVQLDEIIVFGGDPRELIKKAVKNLKINYPTEQNNIKAHYRNLIKENEEYVFFTECAILVQNPSYLSKKNQVSKVQVYDVRSSSNKSKLFTHFRITLENNINAIDFFKNKPFLSKDLNNYIFKVDRIIPYDNYLVYAITFEPKQGLERKFFFTGTLYVETKNFAFVKMEYIITSVSEKYTFVRYKGSHNEFVQTYLTEKYEILFRPFQSKWIISYISNEALSTIKYTSDNKQINLLGIQELLVSDSEANSSLSIDESKTISIKDDINKYSSFFDENMWVKFNQILPNKKLESLYENR